VFRDTASFIITAELSSFGYHPNPQPRESMVPDSIDVLISMDGELNESEFNANMSLKVFS
jgi:hypothetical protein